MIILRQTLSEVTGSFRSVVPRLNEHASSPITRRPAYFAWNVTGASSKDYSFSDNLWM
jgi:hypothetical protein